MCFFCFYTSNDCFKQAMLVEISSPRCIFLQKRHPSMQDISNDSIKRNIKHNRERLDLTQEEMAERVGISSNAFCAIESGKTKVINSNIPKIAKAFGISVAELVNGFEPISSEEAGLDEVKVNYDSRLHSIQDGFVKEMNVLRAENKRLAEKLEDKEALIQTQKKLISQYEKKLRK